IGKFAKYVKCQLFRPYLRNGSSDFDDSCFVRQFANMSKCHLFFAPYLRTTDRPILMILAVVPIGNLPICQNVTYFRPYLRNGSSDFDDSCLCSIGNLPICQNVTYFRPYLRNGSSDFDDSCFVRIGNLPICQNVTYFRPYLRNGSSDFDDSCLCSVGN
ncbi:hypothetical protein KSF78_0009712, partial [Schistosoma japonicum]